MLKLPSHYYATVYFQEVPLCFDFIDRHYLERLNRNAAFVEFVKTNGAQASFTDFMKQHQSFESSAAFTKKASLSHLGLKTVMPGKSILTEKDFSELNQYPWSITDRYFYPFGHRHIGSSRHMILYDCQLKGVGRNELSHRSDYLHSWGGYDFSASVQAMLKNVYLDAFTPLGCLPILASGRYQAEGEGKWAVQFRCANGYRLAHFDPGAEVWDDRASKILRQSLMEHLQEDSLDLIKEKILAQYIAYFMHGINPRSALIPENILVDGRAIDTDDFEIVLADGPVLTFALDDPKENGVIHPILRLPHIFELIKQRKLQVRCDNLSRLQGLWTMHATIIDQLFGLPVDFQKNHHRFLTKLKESAPKQFSPFIDFYLGELPESITPKFKTTFVEENLVRALESFHLVDAMVEGQETRTYSFTVALTPQAQNLKNWMRKTVTILQQSIGASDEMAMENFEQIKGGLLHYVQSTFKKEL